MNQLPEPRREPNYWAIASLVCGILGLLLALTAPIPFVPLISIFNWPLGLLAIIAAWVARRQNPQGLAEPAAGRAKWGVRLGCAGWTLQFIVSTIKVILIAGFLSYFLGSAVSSWLGTATPVP
jgi:hypothetical protein